VSTPTDQFVEVDVDSPNAYARGRHLNNGLLGTGEPVLVRLFEPVGISSEFAETGPLVSSVPRDARDSVIVVQGLLDVPCRSFDAADTDLLIVTVRMPTSVQRHRRPPHKNSIPIRNSSCFIRF
jgi:hypothetical protein